jgi:hypothetical protein
VINPPIGSPDEVPKTPRRNCNEFPSRSLRRTLLPISVQRVAERCATKTGLSRANDARRSLDGASGLRYPHPDYLRHERQRELLAARRFPALARNAGRTSRVTECAHRRAPYP